MMAAPGGLEQRGLDAVLRSKLHAVFGRARTEPVVHVGSAQRRATTFKKK